MSDKTVHTRLITPYGGRLVDVVVPREAAEELEAKAERLPSLQLSERWVCDLELRPTGAFSPLDRFMGWEDHERVVEEMRLASGTVFPIPVTLPVEPDPTIQLDGRVALRDPRNELLAVMAVEEIYEWDRGELAEKVFGTRDVRHPLVAEMQRWGRINLSGRLQVVSLPKRYGFRVRAERYLTRHHELRGLRATPAFAWVGRDVGSVRESRRGGEFTQIQ